MCIRDSLVRSYNITFVSEVPEANLEAILLAIASASLTSRLWVFISSSFQSTFVEPTAKVNLISFMSVIPLLDVWL